MPIIEACNHCGAKNRILASRLADIAKCGNCKQDIGPVDKPLAVDATTFDEIISGIDVPVLVDFWAEWCGPCRMAAPHVETTAKSLRGRTVVLKVDTEKNPQLAARYHVRGIPNFAVFSAGKLVQQQAGLVDSSEMIRWLEAAGA